MQVIIQQIPPGTTSLVQPLDVFGFRPWKNYVRHIEDFVILHDIPVTLNQRNNALKVQSLAFEQLRSPRYRALFQLSWHKAGLLQDRPNARFPTPVEFGFNGSDLLCSSCDGLKMINCSWCKQSLCFDHFFVEHHICNNYVP